MFQEIINDCIRMAREDLLKENSLPRTSINPYIFISM